MAYTNPYSEAAPLGSVAANLIDDLMRSGKVDIRERLESIFGVGIFTTDPVTVAQVKLTAAVGKILPGATSISIRNNADSADNLLIADAGQVQVVRGKVLIAGGAGDRLIEIGDTAATFRYIRFASGTRRWEVGTNNTAEGGANAGSDYFINRFDDTGSLLGTGLQITRSNGLVTINGGISVTGASSFLGGAQVSFSGSIAISGSTVIIDGASGIKRTLRYTTGSSLRWEAQTTNTAESGANAGSDYALSAYDDSGVFIINALLITRANRLATFGGDVTITHGGGPSFLNISNAAGQDRRIKFQSSGVDRFTIGIGSGAESGGNAGSDIVFRVMDDAGATISDFLTVVRSTGISTFSKQVIINNDNTPTLEIKKNASTDNRYIRLTDTEATGQQWDLIQRSVAAGSHFLIFNVTGNIIAVQITPVGSVTIGSQSTSSIGLTVDRNVVAGNNGLIQLTRQGSTKGFIGLDGSDNFTIFDSGGIGLVTISSTIVSGPLFNATTGFRIGGAAASGRFLRGDGTNFISNTIQSGDLPTALTPTTLTVGGGSLISRVLFGSIAWNPGTLTAGSFASTTITVTGAQVGDAVFFGDQYINDNAHGILRAYVSALNTVTVQIVNESGSSITLTNRTIKVWVIG